MNKLLVALFVVFATVLLAGSAFATLTVSDLTLGDDGTVRANSEADDEDDEQGDTFTADLVVTTTNETVLSGATISFSGLSDFNLSCVGGCTNRNFSANSSTTVEIQGQIPEDWDSDVENGNDAVSILVSGAKVTVTSGSVSADGKVYALAESGLTLDNVELVVDGDTMDADDDDAETIAPGSKITLQFVLQNNFDKNSNLDMEDISVDLESSNNDVEFDDDSIDVDVDADKEKTITADFDIDWGDVEDGDDSTITITVSGTDDNGAKHEVEYDFKIGFEYGDVEITVNDFVVSPSQICAGDFATVSFVVENEGNDDQDNMRVQVTQSQFSWDVLASRFSLDGRDDEDTESQDFSYNLKVPANTKAADYNVRVTVFYEDEDGDDTSDFQDFKLTVDSCGATPSTGTGSTQANQSTTIVVDQQGTGSTVSSTGTTVVATAKPKSDVAVISGLVVLGLLLIAVIALLIVALRR